MHDASSNFPETTLTTRLIGWAVLAAAANLVAALLAVFSVRWSVKPALSPWTGLIWPYAFFTSSGVIWLAVLCAPVASAARLHRMVFHFQSAAAAFAGSLPMLIISIDLTRPADPWLPLMGMLAVAAVGVLAPAVVGVGAVRLQFFIKCVLWVWMFVLPAMGMLQIGIATRHMPSWAAISPLYWLQSLVLH